MVILQAVRRGQASFYFKGSESGFEWSTDRDQAKRYPDETTARADLIGSPMATDHYTMRATPTAA